MDKLTFREEDHTYWVGKKRIPGVSEILQKVGLSKDYSGVDPFYRDRGIATHMAIQLHLEGKLDRSSLDAVIVPHFEAFLKYWETKKYERIVSKEKPLYCSFRYEETFAGTPDLITEKAIYDWKCSKSHDRAAELQGEAYKLLAECNPEILGPLNYFLPFIVVELHDNGEFEEFDYGIDNNLWPSVMDLYNWKMKKRKKA